jgi:hypothetical protein
MRLDREQFKEVFNFDFCEPLADSLACSEHAIVWFWRLNDFHLSPFILGLSVWDFFFFTIFFTVLFFTALFTIFTCTFFFLIFVVFLFFWNGSGSFNQSSLSGTCR